MYKKKKKKPKTKTKNKNKNKNPYTYITFTIGIAFFTLTDFIFGSVYQAHPFRRTSSRSTIPLLHHDGGHPILSHYQSPHSSPYGRGSLVDGLGGV
jgi:hypothetical protein